MQRVSDLAQEKASEEWHVYRCGCAEHIFLEEAVLTCLLPSTDPAQATVQQAWGVPMGRGANSRQALLFSKTAYSNSCLPQPSAKEVGSLHLPSPLYPIAPPTQDSGVGA